MKRLIFIICALAAFGLGGCSKDAGAPGETTPVPETVQSAVTISETEALPEEATTETGISEDIPPSDDVFTMDDYTEPVCGTITNTEPLYQDDYLTITADGFETDSTDTFLFLTLTNHTDQDLSINCTSSALNDFMVDSGFTDDVAAGATSETALRFENTLINACGMHTIASAELSFAIFDLTDYTLLAETGPLFVTTDAAVTEDPDAIKTGELLYSMDNFQIIGKGIIEDDDGMAMIALLIINQSGKDVAVSLNDNLLIVDGKEYVSTFSEDVLQGKNAIALVSVYDPEEGAIDFQESAQLSFFLQDLDTWETISVTDPVTILRDVL